MTMYRCGGSTTTDITPSNTSPVALVTDEAVNPLTNGYAIENYTPVTPAHVGTAISSGQMIKVGGNGVIVDNLDPASITPSNVNPASLPINTAFQTSPSGYAIESYSLLQVPPSNPPQKLLTNNVYIPRVDHYAVQNIGTASPSNDDPAQLSRFSTYYMNGNGYAIESYDSVTPSSTAHAVANGDVVKIGGGGFIVSSLGTGITPSDTNPVALTANVAVLPSRNGYAIESNPTSKTPSDTNPPSIASGAIIKASAAGYFTKKPHPVFGGTPDKTFVNNTAGTSGTATITVTQKPRYIVYSMWSRTSNYYGFTGIIDVTNNQAYRMGYMASGAISESWTNWSNFFTTVSASQVIYAYNAVSYNSRIQIQIFY